MIFIFAFVLYFVSVFGGFVQDDLKVVASDPEMGKMSALVATFTRPYYYMDGGNAGIYRPMTSFSLYLNALVTGKEAWGFHLVNVLLYAAICWLVFAVLMKLDCHVFRLWRGRNDGKWGKMAFLGAIFFTVLPIHTEAVNNIVGRAEILSLGFLLLAMLGQFKKKWELSAFMFLLALLSKETAIVGLPILGYLIVMGKEDKNTKIGVCFFYVLIMGCYLFLRLMVLGGGGMANNATIVENPLKFVSTGQRIMNAFALVPLGIGKVIFPWHLSYDYSFNQLKLATGWFDWRVILGILMMLGSLGSLFTSLRKNKLWILGQAFFWGPILVTGNFLFPVGTIFGERLWFWPSLGLVMMGVALLYLFGVHKNRTSAQLSLPPLAGSHVHGPCGFVATPAQIFSVLFLMVVFILAGRTMIRNLDWLSQERLFVHDAAYATDSVMVQSNAAAMYLMKKDLPDGEKYMERADAIYPKYPELLNNWGMYYLWNGENEKAKSKFEECLTERPGYSLCESNMELIK